MTIQTNVRARLRSAVAAALTMLVCLPPASVFGQTPSLVELARKEQERRKTVKGSPKVYSDKNLPKPAPPPAAALPPATPPPAEQKPAEAQAKPEEQKDEAWWRARMAQTREELRRNEVFADALQSRVNALSNDAANIDDPYQRAKAAQDRQKAIAELDRVKAEIEQAKKQISDIEEEARKAGVPPGWLR
jgi:DNA repair exonuclease SbcCD ATPase subunit